MVNKMRFSLILILTLLFTDKRVVCTQDYDSPRKLLEMGNGPPKIL